MEQTLAIAILALKDISVEDSRQRTVYDREKLIELANNIRDDRLIHPPTIDTLENMRLVCGGRRVKAMKAIAAKGLSIRFNGEELPVGYAPFCVVGSTDVLVLEEIELNENKIRDNLTWQDEERALARIKQIVIDRKLREKKEEKPLADEDELLKELVVTKEEIAQAADVSRATVTRHEQIIDHLSDPEVAKAKTKKEAIKIIEKKNKQEHLAELAKTTVVKKSDHQIRQGDCRELIKQVPTGIVKAVITDPPYGINMHLDQSWDGTWHEYNDTESYCFNLIESLIPEWDRVMEEQGHLYVFCDFAKFEKIKAIFDSYRKEEGKKADFLFSMESMLSHNMGLKELKSVTKSQAVFDVMYFPMIWNKGNVASYPRPDHWPRKSYECVLYAIKGGHKQNKLDLAVVDVPQIQIQDHQAGKPKALYAHFINRSTVPGDVVLDCFAGQGNLLRAAHEAKRKSINFELADEYYPLLAKAYRETEE